jgi:hypothetical protein
MTIQAPYKRTVRPFKVGDYVPPNGLSSYVRTPSYSHDPRPYIRGFLVLQRDIRSLFEFIHPSDNNLGTYSEHIGILLIRTCFEVETNLTAILRENGYAGKPDAWNMKDYNKIDQSHRLSGYEVLLPEWTGTQNTVKPFEKWSSACKLDWYNAYNKFKHDRVANLSKATFRHLIDAWSGLFALLGAQYFLDEFSVEKETTGFADILNPGEFWHGIGGYLKVKFPMNWPDANKYDFSLNAQNFHDPTFSVNFPY